MLRRARLEAKRGPTDTVFASMEARPAKLSMVRNWWGAPPTPTLNNEGIDEHG